MKHTDEISGTKQTEISPPMDGSKEFKEKAVLSAIRGAGRQIFCDKITAVILAKPVEAFDTDNAEGKPDLEKILEIGRNGGEEVRLPSLSSLKNYLALKKAEGKKDLPLKLAEGCVINPEYLYEVLNIIDTDRAIWAQKGHMLYITDDKNNEAVICLIDPKKVKEPGTIEEA